MNREQLFRKLYELKQQRHAYLDTIPQDIQSAFFDNAYVSTLDTTIEILLEKVFGEVYGIEWFLYEWKPGMEVGITGEPLTPIYTIDDYILWVKVNEGWLQD